MLNSESYSTGWRNISELVKSLTPNEKGYFKKYCYGFTKEAQNNYLRLFQILEKENIIHDKLIRDKFHNKQINIHSIRNFLYKQILKSLRAYHSEKHIQYTIREMLDYVEILSDKGLFEQSIQFINKGINLSDPVTLPAYQILFRTQQIQMLRFFNEEEKLKKTDEIVASITESAEGIKHSYLTRQGLTKALFYVNTYFPLRNPIVKKEVKTLLSELKKIPDSAKQNYRVRNSRNAAISLLYRLLNDWDKALMYQEKTIRIMETVDAQALNRNIPVINAHYNYISLLLNKGDFLLAETEIKKMHKLPIYGLAEERYLKAILLQLQLDWIVFKKDFDHANFVIRDAEEFLKEPHPINGVYYDTLIRIAAYYVYTSDFNAALEKINLLLQTSFQHSLKSFPLHVRLMNILIHYEFGNTLILPSLIRNTYRFMMKQELKFEIEKIILNFFKRMLNHVSKKQIEREFNKLSAQLNRAAGDAYEQQALQSFFDYRYWLEKKLKK